MGAPQGSVLMDGECATWRALGRRHMSHAWRSLGIFLNIFVRVFWFIWFLPSFLAFPRFFLGLKENIQSFFARENTFFFLFGEAQKEHVFLGKKYMFQSLRKTENKSCKSRYLDQKIKSKIQKRSPNT